MKISDLHIPILLLRKRIYLDVYEKNTSLLFELHFAALNYLSRQVRVWWNVSLTLLILLNNNVHDSVIFFRSEKVLCVKFSRTPPRHLSTFDEGYPKIIFSCLAWRRKVRIRFRKSPRRGVPWWMCGRAHAFYSRRGPTRNLNTELEVPVKRRGATQRVHSAFFPARYLFPTRLPDNKDKSMSAKLAKFGRPALAVPLHAPAAF